jgi:hypothetical protein
MAESRTIATQDWPYIPDNAFLYFPRGRSVVMKAKKYESERRKSNGERSSKIISSINLTNWKNLVS